MNKSEENIVKKENWERNILEKVALSSIKEQTKARRWSIFFKLFFVAYILIITLVLVAKYKSSRNQSLDYLAQKVDVESEFHIALIKLSGIIAADKEVNAEAFSYMLRSAAAKDDVAGILIVANSSGGSPVQSSMIYKAIREVKEDYPNKKIITSITDMCASGCYYIVSATDEIYADKSSIVGSIGVISQSYAYGDVMKKLGVVPRTFKAGKYKDFMNPVRPINEFEQKHMQKLLDKLHNNFITDVKAGRGKRLKDNPDLFTGLFWDGQTSLELGLIDGLADVKNAASKIGDYPVYDYSPKNPMQEIMQEIMKEIGLQVENSAMQVIDEISSPKLKLN